MKQFTTSRLTKNKFHKITEFYKDPVIVKVVEL